MTKRPGRSAANDPGLAALIAADADAIVFVAKTWDYHVHVALGCTLEENLACIVDSVKAAIAAGREAMVDCEHFFDGYKANPAYALECAQAAYEAGARWVVLCDTNGGTLPDEVERIVAEAARVVPGDHIGIHAHNDTDNAVANSLAAVRAGARQVQGHVERPRRALRQRQPRFADPVAGAEIRPRRPVRDRRVGSFAARARRKSRTLSTNC